ALALAALAGLLLPWPGRLRRAVPVLVAASLMAMLFMAALGVSFALVLNSLAPAGAPLAALPFAAAIAVLGWLTGYLTPGAPGGLGTREAVMLVLLAGSVSEGEALIAITLFRLVTVLGDLVCFGVGWLLFRGTASPDPGVPAA
ncbi:lysylphosphatidylglycerol synthase domain-containing protein, partial [Sandarakinorhabdus rubra]